MPLSERTLEEMRVGAEAVARNERQRTLDILVKRGDARLTQLSGNDTVVWVGIEPFIDPRPGPWPSELLMARVALAIEGGMHRKKE